MTGSFRTPRRYDLPAGFVDAVGAAEDAINWRPATPASAPAPVLTSDKAPPVVTNAELVRELVERVGMSKSDASKALDVVVEAMVERLVVGHSVKLKNFGTFRTSRSVYGSKKRAAAMARKKATASGAEDAVQFIPGVHLRHVIGDQEA